MSRSERRITASGFVFLLALSLLAPNAGVHADSSPDFSELSQEDFEVPGHPEIQVSRLGPSPSTYDNVYVHYHVEGFEDAYLSISYNVDPEKVKAAYDYHVDQPPWGAIDCVSHGYEYTETRYWFLVERVVEEGGSLLPTGAFKGRRLLVYEGNYLINVEGVTLEKGDSARLTTLLDLLEEHAKDLVIDQMGDEKEEDESYYIYPSLLNRVEPGETIEFSVITEEGYRVSDELLSEFRWALGACKSVSDYLSASPSAGKQWITIGEIDPSSGVFTGRNIGSCEVYLYHDGSKADQATVEVVCPFETPGDLDAVLELYRNEIPWGPILEDVYTGRAPICFSKVSPGAANNLLYSSRTVQDAGARVSSWFKEMEMDKSWKEWVERYGPFTCGGYQEQVMKFLHNRIQADGENCHLLNGYDFKPIRGKLGMHHAVVVYPKEGDWERDGVVLDPWPTQKPAWYTIEQWRQRYWPAQEETFESDRDAYDKAGARSAGVLHCPVQIVITDDQGRRSGVLGDGSYVNEIPDARVMGVPDDDGGSEWYYDLNSEESDSYSLEITGTGDGTFTLLSFSGYDGSFRVFEEQPIAEGQTAEITIDDEPSQAPLTLSNGTAVEPQVYTLELQPEPAGQGWERVFNLSLGRSVQQTADGGYIIAGTRGNDVLLIKTDPDGRVEWEETYGTNETERGYSAQQTSDGGYIVAGATYASHVRKMDVYLVKTDSGGGVVWERRLGGSSEDEGYSVQQTSDGGYVVAGRTLSLGAGGSDAYLIKTDADGNPVWERTFGGPGDDRAASVQQTEDGGYIIAGTEDSFGEDRSDIYLVKTDADGGLVWESSFGGVEMERGHSARQTADGGYVVVGETMSFGAGVWDIYMIKTDGEGKIAWERTFGGPIIDEGLSVWQTDDGGYVLTGSAGGELYLVRTDSEGEMTWERTYGPGGDCGYSVQQTSDGGYIAVGVYERFDAYLIKLYDNSTEAEEGQVTLAQYSLVVQSLHGHVSGGGSYSEGSVASFGVSPIVIAAGEGVRHLFQGWRSTAPGGYTGRENPAEVEVAGDIVEVAEWSTQYLLDVDSPIDVWGEGWYDEGSVAELYAESPRGFIVRRVFKGWSGDVDSTLNPLTLSVEGPTTVVAEWATDYTQLIFLAVLISVAFWFWRIRRN